MAIYRAFPGTQNAKLLKDSDFNFSPIDDSGVKRQAFQGQDERIKFLQWTTLKLLGIRLR